MGFTGAGRKTCFQCLRGDSPKDGEATLPNLEEGPDEVFTSKALNMTFTSLGMHSDLQRNKRVLRRYLPESQGIIVIVDSTSMVPYHKLFGDEEGKLSSEVPLLVLANKQDTKEEDDAVLSVDQLVTELELSAFSGGREWCVQGCSLATEKFEEGSSLHSGLQWLTEKLS